MTDRQSTILDARAIDRTLRRMADEIVELNEAESLRLIADALDRLPPQHREVIALVSLEEMSYRDVSEILGVPMGTVMSRLSRAREQMRGLLESRGTSVLRRVK